MQFRLIALGMAMVLGGVLFRLIFTLPAAQEQLSAQLSAQQFSMASYVARDIDHSLVARRALIGELAASLPPALLARPPQLAAWLGERQRFNPLFNSRLLLIGADGAGLAAYPAPPGPQPARYAHAAWFQAALARAAPVIGAPQRGLRGEPDGEPVIVMAAPVRDAGGRVLAVLAGVATLDETGFLGRLQQHRFGGSGGFLLVSPPDRLFVGASEPSLVLKPTPPAGVNLLHDRAMSGYRGSGITLNAKGVEELSSMASVPSTGWFVVARMPTAEAFRPIQAMRAALLKGSVLVLVAMTGILLLLLPRMLRPLTEAAHAMREMADARRALAPLPLRRNDEVGGLVLGFNYLVARLGEKESALKASEARLEFMAHHDPLTGLYNRTMLQERLQQALARAGRGGAPFALLFCDLDSFKPVNDEHGHGAGDAVLIEVAARLSRGRRQVDTVARLGGDEFVILLAELDDARAAAELVGRQCLAALAAPYQIGAVTLALSASIGVACYRGAPASGSQLMSQADIAMYQAKRAGKNALCFFEPAEIAA